MAAFSLNGEGARRVDLDLMRSGFVSLYFRREVLDADVAWLREHRYRVVEFDCTWPDPEAMHEAFATTLSFPAYYGRNLSALNDCLSEVEFDPDGGLALVLRRFDAFASRHPTVAQAVLDIIADNARSFLLFGGRVIALVQSDDPRIAFEPVGATAVRWNPKEWLNATRGV